MRSRLTCWFVCIGAWAASPLPAQYDVDCFLYPIDGPFGDAFEFYAERNVNTCWTPEPFTEVTEHYGWPQECPYCDANYKCQWVIDSYGRCVPCRQPAGARAVDHGTVPYTHDEFESLKFKFKDGVYPEAYEFLADGAKHKNGDRYTFSFERDGRQDMLGKLIAVKGKGSKWHWLFFARELAANEPNEPTEQSKLPAEVVRIPAGRIGPVGGDLADGGWVWVNLGSINGSGKFLLNSGGKPTGTNWFRVKTLLD